MSAPLPEDYSVILDAWDATQADFRELAGSLSDADWSAPTGLAGWSVGDIVGHVGWIEGVLLGEVDPPHEVDWTAMPHVVSDFGRVCEVPVDLRRSWSREAVVIELEQMMERRRTVLVGGFADGSAADGSVEVAGPLGLAPLFRVVRMRTFDTWVHEQDIRQALGRPGHEGSAGAQATAAQLIPALPVVFSKRGGGQPGEVLVVAVTGPEVSFTRVVSVDPDGRGRLVADDLVDQAGPATVTLTMPWSTYRDLATGRQRLDQVRPTIDIAGDGERAQSVLAAFTVTP